MQGVHAGYRRDEPRCGSHSGSTQDIESPEFAAAPPMARTACVTIMIIRDEIPDDVPLIATVVIEAFRTAALRPGRPQPPNAGLAEGKIVEGLRASKALTLSLVAVEDGDEIVGHVAFSPVLIDRRDCNWFGMAPVS